MPASVRRHNLQRLREELNLTQPTLGSWLGRSAATIKAVEIGKLALSENLAALIASVTQCSVWSRSMRSAALSSAAFTAWIWVKTSIQQRSSSTIQPGMGHRLGTPRGYVKLSEQPTD